jgi:hypothetical protein
VCTKKSDFSASVSNIFCNAFVQFTDEYVFFGYVLLSAFLDPCEQMLHHSGVTRLCRHSHGRILALPWHTIPLLFSIVGKDRSLLLLSSLVLRTIAMSYTFSSRTVIKSRLSIRDVNQPCGHATALD